MISGRRQNVASPAGFSAAGTHCWQTHTKSPSPQRTDDRKNNLGRGKNDTNMLAVLIGLNIKAVVGQLLPLHGAHSFLRAKRKRSGEGYGAISIWRQAAGRSASVIGGLGFGGVVGSLGWRTGSLNQ
jgi:hypothetical protein